MTGFSDLPNELVLKILHHVPPRDLDSACTITKSISLLAAPILKDHRRLKQQFSDYCDVRVIGDDDPPLTKLFADTVATPRIAHYVRRLDVICERADFRTLRLKRTCLSDANSLQLVKTAIENLGIVQTNEVDEWLQALQDNMSDRPALALLLLDLPNLNRLDLTFGNDSIKFLSMTAQKLLNAPTGTYLAHLKHVTIGDTWMRSVREHPDRLRFLMSLLALPSLASCRLLWLALYDDDCAIESMICPKRFNLTDLVFMGCTIEEKTLLELLKRTQNLESFRYDLPYDTETAGLDWQWLVNGLSCHTKHSLKKLQLLSKGQAYRQEKTWSRSIRDFKVLQEIYVELPVFLNYDESVITNLQDILPVSIREIWISTLFPHDSSKDEQRLAQTREVVQSILEVRSELVPQLREIHVLTRHEERCAIFADVWEACDLQGISFTFE